MKNYKIISWNVNGIRAIMKKGFLKDIKEISPDIICLQETKASEIDAIKAIFTPGDIFKTESVVIIISVTFIA